jgi:hypothetical protein
VAVGVAVAVAAGVAVAVAVAVGEGAIVAVAVAVAVGVAVAVAVGVGLGVEPPEQAPGPAVLFMKPETMPLNCEDAVVPDVAVPVVFTTTTKTCPVGTVNE